MQSDLLMIKLLIGVYWFDEALQDGLKRAGWPPVTRAQSLLFSNISAGEHRATQIAQNLGVSRQSISQMLAELEARGLVVTETDPRDRRARIVQFSPAAASLRQAAGGALRKLEAELETRIGAERTAALLDALSVDWGEPPRLELPPAKGRAGADEGVKERPSRPRKRGRAA